ncbi:GNAT family N-acetyltransferase [Halovivax gelatinilyticus]|uniref:GNAT family N-acetyltransferase n=1 Tax=Halovivax gelatinilyticus TaxID=2961597 RepID=UPI0020CA4E7A|nr:GNAT family protein [Halovivax gelatinilyticus]
MPGPAFLSGERVSLHPIESEDNAFCRRLLNDSRVRTRIAVADPITEHGEREWIERQEDGDGWNFLICESNGESDGDGELGRVGTIGLTPENPTWGNAEIGYSIAPDHWCNGYATDAVSLICQYAFDERRIEKLFAITLADNAGSGRVLEKNGFEREGRLRGEAFVGGERVDAIRYGLLGAAWRDD